LRRWSPTRASSSADERGSRRMEVATDDARPTPD
jgi:hypothetical protein